MVVSKEKLKKIKQREAIEKYRKGLHAIKIMEEASSLFFNGTMGTCLSTGEGETKLEKKEDEICLRMVNHALKGKEKVSKEEEKYKIHLKECKKCKVKFNEDDEEEESDDWED